MDSKFEQHLSISYFAPLAQELAQAGYRAVAINPRGAGASTGPLAALTLDTLTADVAGVITALHCAPVHIVGHAFGSRMARCLAIDYPHLVRSVIVLAGGGSGETDAEMRAAIHTWFRADATEAECIEALGAMLAKSSSAQAVWQQVKRWPAAAAAQLGVMQTTRRNDWRGTPGNAPYLLVQGDEDRLAPPSSGRALRDRYGNRIHLVEIPHAGHVLLPEQPEAVADAVITFLREH